MGAKKQNLVLHHGAHGLLGHCHLCPPLSCLGHRKSPAEDGVLGRRPLWFLHLWWTCSLGSFLYSSLFLLSAIVEGKPWCHPFPRGWPPLCPNGAIKSMIKGANCQVHSLGLRPPQDHGTARMYESLLTPSSLGSQGCSQTVG